LSPIPQTTSGTPRTFLTGLQCHLCKAFFPAEATYVCDKCLGPLEPVYDYKSIHVTREQIEKRPKNLWRYRELLPITGEPLTGLNSGFTPLVRCDRLAARLGLRELYIKDDSVNHPTLSYKDRVVSVAATRAVELCFNDRAWDIGRPSRRNGPSLGDDDGRIEIGEIDDVAFPAAAQVDPVNLIGEFANDSDTHAPD
jgi:hypothetical protein